MVEQQAVARPEPDLLFNLGRENSRAVIAFPTEGAGRRLWPERWDGPPAGRATADKHVVKVLPQTDCMSIVLPPFQIEESMGVFFFSLVNIPFTRAYVKPPSGRWTRACPFSGALFRSTYRTGVQHPLYKYCDSKTMLY